MIRSCVLISVFLLASSAVSQTFQWVNVNPIDLSTNPGLLQQTLAIDTAGNPVITRLVRSRLIYGIDYFGDHIAERLDAAGQTRFADTVFGKVNIQAITVDRSNNLIVAGTFLDTIRVDTAMRTIPSISDPNCFILKLGPNGTLIWLKNMTQSDPVWSGIGNLKVDTDNNLWVAVEGGFQATYVKKLDGNGNVLASYEQTNVKLISGLAIDADRNVWVAGSTFDGPQSFNGLPVDPPFFYNMYVAKYNPAGVATWVRFVEDATLQFPQIAIQGNGAIMGGNLMIPTSFGGLPANGPQWVYDFFITKIDSGGQFTWLREIPSGNSRGDATVGRGPFLAVAYDGSILVSGFTRYSVDWGGGIVTQSGVYMDALILQYSPEGAIRWAKTAGSVDWSNRGDAVAVNRSGITYVAGLVGPNPIFDSLRYVGGNVNSFVGSISPMGVSSVHRDLIQRSFALYQNYPNPFNPATSVRFDVPSSSRVTLKIYDVVGREVATLVEGEMKPGAYTVPFDATRLSSGVYFYTLRSGTFVETKRLVLMK